MPTTTQTIKEAEGRLGDKYGAFELCDVISFGDRERLKSHITQTLLAVFESELESVPEDEEVGDIYPHIEERAKEAMEQIKKVGINQERARQRTHLTEVINYLKQK